MKKITVVALFALLASSVFAYESQLSLGLGYGFSGTTIQFVGNTAKTSYAYQSPAVTLEYNGYFTKMIGFNLKASHLSSMYYTEKNSAVSGKQNSYQSNFSIGLGPAFKFEINNFMLMANVDFVLGFINFNRLDTVNDSVLKTNNMSIGGEIGLYGGVQLTKLFFAKAGASFLFGTLVGDAGNYRKNGGVVIEDSSAPITDRFKSNSLWAIVPTISVGVKF